MALDPNALAVYVVTTDAGAGRGHRDVALAAIEGGATTVQLRAPELGPVELLPLASELASACRDAGVLFIVNDRPDVARVSGASGAHLGQRDDLETACARLGPDRLLGISVQDPVQVSRAVELGADYLGVTVHATDTKPEAEPIGLDGLRAVVGASRLPVVGIGGVDASNAAEVIEAGATGVAVVSAVSGAEDMVRATQELAQVVHDARGRMEGAG